MIALLATLLQVSLPAQETEQPPVPDPQRVSETLRELEEAFRARDAQTKAASLERASSVADPKVVEAIGRALDDSERSVVLAAIQSLRYQRHPSALDCLHRAYAADKTLRKDEEFSASLLKAIGQHADPKSIPLLSDEPFETQNYQAIRARILGLGRIRTLESVAALFDLLKSTNQKSIDRAMDDFRLSLAVLTGTDQGPTSAQWLRWWNDNRKTFVLPTEFPALPRPMLERWQSYWNLELGNGRGRRREDRGDQRAL